MRKVFCALVVALLIGGCGSSTGDRAASGAGIGAAAGAAVGVLTGVSVVNGALIGAAAGGLTGGLTDEDTINLGDPIWADKGESDQSGASTQNSTKASNTLVREVQYGLSQLGYDPGPVDGQYGPRTRDAVRAYQSDNSLLVDGQVSSALAAHIRERVADNG